MSAHPRVISNNCTESIILIAYEGKGYKISLQTKGYILSVEINCCAGDETLKNIANKRAYSFYFNNIIEPFLITCRSISIL